jgi:hypothetical protein
MGSRIAHHRRATLRAMTRLAAERMAAAGRPAVDPVIVIAIISAMQSVADTLLLEPQVDAATLARANLIALRIVGATLAGPGDPVPPIPAPRSERCGWPVDTRVN